MKRVACLTFLCSLLAGTAHGQGILSAPLRTEVGPAVVVEADHLAINKTVFALYGVDAPIRIQWCMKDGQPFGCGVEAMAALQALVENQTVTCEQVRDPHLRRRVLRFGRCTIGDLDLAAELVRQGMAMAFRPQSEDYVALEEEAQAGRVGLWAADEFTPPWEWEETHLNEQ
ncbi:thermonuclease family protein [Devosia sp. 2618]|uniref:thermonuclease family protein n=1 Tax=Devosia sp. 2618 TaxID=3156454 RepID=UPI003391A0AB